MNDPNLVIRLVLIVLLGTIPLSVCQRYEDCSRTTECGDIREIRYPFWGEGRPEYCGYPGFEINCRDSNTLLITISSETYRVLQIDNSNLTIRVSRDDFSDTLCPTSLVNTTLDFTIFDFSQISNDQNISLFYGCRLAGGQLPVPPTPSFPYEFNCGRGDSLNTFFTREFLPGPGVSTAFNLSCDTTVIVPVNRTAARVLGDARTASSSALEEAIDSGFSIQWSADNVHCGNCVGSGGACGRDLGSGSFACYCRNGTQCYDPPRPEGGWTSHSQTYLIIGLSLGLPSGIAILFFAIVCIKKQRTHNQEGNQDIDKVLLHHGSLAPKRYTYNQIKKMTKSFSEKLGRGAFGIVYKGKLPEDGQLVAVKVLTETDDNIPEDFVNEVSSISKTSHVNIVNLLGFCYERNKRALVYEFMPNKSLDNFMTRSRDKLGWDKMYEIAVGVARGLEYLHRGCSTRIVHFDIKPQNILLDEDMSPKISDFGLAKLFQKKQSMISMLGARGTIGYIAPEVFSRSFGGVSHKSDVYSYGMMLLEMAGVKKAVESGEVFFHDRIYECVLVDDVEEVVRKMLLVGVWCIQIMAADRPSMTKVVEMLEGKVESIQVPPKPCW